MNPPTTALAGAKRLLSIDEFWGFVNRPEHADRFFELRRGEVVEISRPTPPHGIVCFRISTKLQNYADQRGTGYVTSNDSGGEELPAFICNVADLFRLPGDRKPTPPPAA